MGRRRYGSLDGTPWRVGAVERGVDRAQQVLAFRPGERRARDRRHVQRAVRPDDELARFVEAARLLIGDALRDIKSPFPRLRLRQTEADREVVETQFGLRLPGTPGLIQDRKRTRLNSST